MAETVQVTINSGPIEGIRKTSRLDTPYISFQKIPYAKPALGPLRFKDPVPADPWTETLNCAGQGPACPQFNNIFGTVLGEEDCLHMNVFTKDVQPEKPYPVMVYIHGGAFMRGSAGTEIYGPDWLLQKDVVVVSFNYRLGAFGFLSVDDPAAEVPGNAGLKDQSLALRWVKENVKFFGGDPNNITAFGESAGGCSLHYQLVSNMSKNLFHRAIVQSGTVLNNWSTVPDNKFSLRLAKSLGWDESQGDARAMVNFLRDQDHNKIVVAQENLLTPEERKDRILFAFGPVIEPYVSKQCLIPTNPKDMCRRAWSRSMPILIGATSEEGLFSYKEAKENPDLLPSLNGEWANMLPLELGPSREGEKGKKLGQQLKELYFKDKDASEETIMDYCTLMSDKLFWHGVHRAILSRINSLEKGPTWVYRFNFDSAFFNHYRVVMCGKEVRGVCHADDLSYIFANIFDGTKVPEDHTPEFRMIQTMVGLWTNFATSGNPNHPDSAFTKGLKWEPIPNKTLPYKVLNINKRLEVVELPEAKRMEFWDSIYENDQLY